MDLRVIEMSGLDDILEMDWMTAHRVVIGRDCRRVTAYTQDGVYVIFKGISLMLYPRPCETLDVTED